MKYLSGALLFLFLHAYQSLPPGKEQPVIEMYRQAERLYNASNPTAQTDSLAQQYYEQAALLFKKTGRQDSLLFDCYLKSGILLQSLGQQNKAIAAYAKSVEVAKAMPSGNTTLLFKPLLFTGNAHYLLDHYNEAVQYLEKAEQIAAAVNEQVDEIERLYNSMGVILYEAGNYKQAVNYFEKALATVREKDPANEYAVVGFQNNLASCYRRLGSYDSALHLYEALLPLNKNSAEIRQNMASLHLSKNAYARAEAILKGIRLQPSSPLRVQVYENLGRANFHMGHTGKARYYYRLAIAADTAMPGGGSTDLGILFKDMGDLLLREKQYDSALASYQHAIITLSGNFNDTAIHRNPLSFTGTFASFYLFDALIAKARALQRSARPDAALSAYRSAFELSQHISRSYDSDEARLFLQQKVYPVYEEGVQLALRLHRLTGDARYPGLAFMFIERSKAAVLVASQKELQIKQIPGIPDSLLQEERRLRYNITRLLLQLSDNTDKTKTGPLKARLRDYEIRLSRIQDKFSDNPSYYQLKYSQDDPVISGLQQRAAAEHAAVLSFYFTNDSLIVYTITAKHFGYHKAALSGGIQQAIHGLRNELDNISTDSAYNGREQSHFLYRQLIAPAGPYLKGIERLIIVPDGELHFIPFEALLTDTAAPQYLVEQFAVSYDYSCSHLQGMKAGRLPAAYKVLAFAPFNTPQAGELAPLPGSMQEVQQLKGLVYTGERATKERFVSMAGHQHNIIHLATHAVINHQDPLHSFIAFYPSGAKDDKLFTPELYNLPLQAVQLAILSACETGSGQLVKGEGIMSLARGFAYAGCPSIITSLWRADDQSTSYIVKQLHHYLQKGKDKDEALRQAKLDYLAREPDRRLRSPAFWAHLVLIGDVRPVLARPWHYWYIAAAVGIIIMCCSVALVIRNRKARKRRRPLQ